MLWGNLADIATIVGPIVTLFGERATKQVMSTIISPVDCFIFSLAPVGFLTACVSLIRLRGSPRLRSFIGRAQEGQAAAEIELCSSTSRHMSELFDNGGIARVFGQPKVLEFGLSINQKNGDLQVDNFHDYLRSHKEDCEVKYSSDHIVDKFYRFFKGTPADPVLRDSNDDPENKEPYFENLTPNLSLNVGIIQRTQTWPLALVGSILQFAVLAWAATVTYYWRWTYEERSNSLYAFVFFLSGTAILSGTAMVSVGMFSCAYHVGDITKECFYQRRQEQSDAYAPIDWLQPVEQRIGDQLFGPYFCTDGNKLSCYIQSWKIESKKHLHVKIWLTLSAFSLGFVLQYVGSTGSAS